MMSRWFLITMMLGANILFPMAAAAGEAAATIDSGDTAWMLVSTALVMLMTPGLAIFYAGMARKKYFPIKIIIKANNLQLTDKSPFMRYRRAPRK